MHSGSLRGTPRDISIGMNYRSRTGVHEGGAMARRPAVLRDGGDDRTLEEHLVATAARLLDERGSARLTVRDIAAAAQVGVGALYNHFADKGELLARALAAHVDTVMRSG